MAGDFRSPRMFGREMALDPALSPLQQRYVRLFGAPVQGLRVRARYVLPHLPAHPRRILDFGCGRGAFALHLASRTEATIVGLDLDDDRLRRAQIISDRLGLRNAHWVRTDGNRPGLKGGFDVTICIDALEDNPDDEAAVRSMAALTAQGGTIIIHVPSHERRRLFFGWEPNFDAPGHVRAGYRVEELRALLEKSGLEVRHVSPTYGYLENLANNISYLITGAREQRKALYALSFPFLLLLSWLGRGARPIRGAGVLAVAVRP